MIKINLNPKKEKRKLPSIKPSVALPTLSFKNETILVIALPLLIVLGTLLYTIYLSSEIKSLEERKYELTREIQKYKDIQAKIDILKKEIEENQKLGEKLNLKIKTYEYLAKGAFWTDEMLRTSIANIPDGVWLESLSISSDKSNISGYAFQPDHISRYYENLKKYYTINFNATESKISSTNLMYYSFTFEIKNRQNKPERSM